ncbi:hypothetical protein ILYODFUR_027759, partial [Ilyodon furcidens]
MSKFQRLSSLCQIFMNYSAFLCCRFQVGVLPKAISKTAFLTNKDKENPFQFQGIPTGINLWRKEKQLSAPGVLRGKEGKVWSKFLVSSYCFYSSDDLSVPCSE